MQTLNARYLTYVLLMVSQDKFDDAAREVRLMRTILERLECSFASQEAKLDRLLSMMKPQCSFSTPDAGVNRQTSFDPAFSSAATPIASGTISDHDPFLDTVLYQAEQEFTGMKILAPWVLLIKLFGTRTDRVHSI